METFNTTKAYPDIDTKYETERTILLKSGFLDSIITEFFHNGKLREWEEYVEELSTIILIFSYFRLRYLYFIGTLEKEIRRFIRTPITDMIYEDEKSES
mmetsp:Transcript_5583/g.4787  ORF Transcript_5583/g.4787 Transcript_5583/m.4787 type:complete len:99 (+) Transcript_5583:17-313(+)